MPDLHVYLVPDAVDEDVVVVIDVLRFTTSAAYALAHGARSLLPCATVDEARATVSQMPAAILAGERQAIKPGGFHLGNSPLEFTRAAVQGRDIVWTTTNGTAAIARTMGSARAVPRDLILASYVNHTAVVSLLEPLLREGTSVAVVCSGREGGFALEDAACAGRLARRLRARFGDALTMNDGARASVCIDEAYGEDFPRLFRDAQGGRFLRDHGFEADLDACGALDAVQRVPRARDGRFVAG